MSYETIAYQVENSVATLTFSRPSALNAFNDQMIAECIGALRLCASEKNVRCVVLTGAGRAFSSGQDLKDIRTRGDDFSIAEHIRTGYNELVRLIVTMEKPVIGAINGVAAGAGCGIALATDIRIAAHTASFIVAFGRIGLVPDSGVTWTLPRLVGTARAYEMAVMGNSISAETALDWGLVNMVVPADQMPEVVSAWAQSLAQGPTLAFGLTKRAMRESATGSLLEALDSEADLQEVSGRSQDFSEGLRAFIEKRDPEFSGE
jgi:2-(1,2-epoxy-1,2-dihydrophenyl)acetyl-CoA isomerase